MSLIDFAFGNPLLERAGWALVHFLWQGTIICIACFLYWNFATRATAKRRYMVGYAAMMLMAICPFITFCLIDTVPLRSGVATLGTEPSRIVDASRIEAATNENRAIQIQGDTSGGGAVTSDDIERSSRDAVDRVNSEPPLSEHHEFVGGVQELTESSIANESDEQAASTSWLVTLRTAICHWLPTLAVFAWLVGILFLMTRMTFGLMRIERLKRVGTGPVSAAMREMIGQISRQLGIRQRLQVFHSDAVTVPTVVGVMEPVILFPLIATSGLNRDQIYALLAHELAHIRRHDFLFNLLQNLVETMLFYHPAVWFVSSRIRQEREHCCDDVATQICRNRIDYAQALLRMEELRQEPKLLIAANGSDLPERIQRILGLKPKRSSTWLNLTSVVAAMMILTFSIVAFQATASLAASSTDELTNQQADFTGEFRDDDPVEAIGENTPSDTVVMSTAASDQVTVRGKVLDDETGEPIVGFVIQAGRFEVDNPKDVTWGYSETRTGSTEGDFRHVIRWDEGWTARILADGFLPMPLLTEAPDGDVDIEYRMIRGQLVMGRVLDHTGKPVADASVFAVGPTGITLEQGKAVHGWGEGEEDESALKVITSEDGKFELPVGEVLSIAVSMDGLDVWPHPLPEDGQPIEIQLPEPATANIVFDIEGAPEEERVFFQLYTHEMDGFERINVERYATIKNGETLELKGLTPGRYQFARARTIRTGNIGHGQFVDRTELEIEAGETTEISFARPNGVQLEGRVLGLSEAGLEKVIVKVKPANAEENDHPFLDWVTTDYLASDEEGNFLTERIPPGTYTVVAEGYLPPPADGGFRSGLPVPDFVAELEVVIPESNMVDELELTLRPRDQ